jgi:hypothetical protein
MVEWIGGGRAPELGQQGRPALAGDLGPGAALIEPEALRAKVIEAQCQGEHKEQRAGDKRAIAPQEAA